MVQVATSITLFHISNYLYRMLILRVFISERNLIYVSKLCYKEGIKENN